MPGINKLRTIEHVERCIVANKLAVRTIKERAKKVLQLIQKCAQEAPEVRDDNPLKWDQSCNKFVAKVLDGDGQEHTRDTEEEKLLMRKIAGESITLLKNQDGTLPLQAHQLEKIAIVGGNAKGLILSGGGSAALKPSYFVSPYDGIVNALPTGIQVTYSEGARGQFIILKSVRIWLEACHSIQGDALP